MPDIAPSNNQLIQDPPLIQDYDPQTTAFATKVLIGVLMGPKVAVLCNRVGIPMTPEMATVITTTVLHKIHEFAMDPKGWTWRDLL
jgi:hypothetical protein